VRALMDEVFGDENFISLITLQKMAGLASRHIKGASDFILWYSKDSEKAKYRQLFLKKQFGIGHGSGARYDQIISLQGQSMRAPKDESERSALLKSGWKIYQTTTLTTFGSGGSSYFEFKFNGKTFLPRVTKGWLTHEQGLFRLKKANRIAHTGKTIRYKRYLDDYPAYEINNVWSDIASPPDVIYVVQTHPKVIERCILMATDPGDLVLDPTCGSGTTAYVAEQWGRRWITIDTSRVALALARARIMGARYPYYLLKDSREGQLKEAEISRTLPSDNPTYGNIRQGFVYRRVPHITLKAIANNAEIDVIWETFQEKLEPLRAQLNQAVGQSWEEWEIPRELGASHLASATHLAHAKKLHEQWWQQRIARQKEIDASIAANADYEYLYDQPYEDKKTVRVAGPFTVESLSPHRVLGVDENDELIDGVAEGKAGYGKGQSFVQMILDNLKMAGVQQAHKTDKITFSSLTPWPGHYICAEGRYHEGGDEDKPLRRAGIFIGPEFGTVARPDLVAAAREAGEAGFDVLIACAFNYDARSTEFDKLGRIPVLKARMNADLHMAADLKNTGQGNLFVIFGEPDIDILPAEDGQIQVKVNGVDVFHPGSGEIRSDGPEGIAMWFVDTDYNEESFFVRQAYFLGANDPYKSLKTTLKAEINREAWDSLHSDVSRPFDKPTSGRIAVKVINHLGDEVMKVFRV
ncbi:MAG: DNA methyltransferase, partial [Anaerolineae bacterium]